MDAALRAACVAHLGRSIDRVETTEAAKIYRVIAGDDRFALREWESTASQAWISASVEFQVALGHHGIAVARPVAGKHGQWVGSDGTRRFTIFEWIDGPVLRQVMNLDHAKALGHLLAEFHRTTEAIALPMLPALDAYWLIDKPLELIAGWPSLAPHIIEEYQHVGRILRLVFSRLPRQAPRYGICHGDFHPNNMLIGAHGLVLIDFDWAGIGWRAYDLAVFDWSTRSMPDAARLQAAFRSGYATIRPLKTKELATVPIFCAARHLFLTGLIVRYELEGRVTGHTMDDGLFARRFTTITTWLHEAGLW